MTTIVGRLAPAQTSATTQKPLRDPLSPPGGDDRRRLHGGERSAREERRPARRRDRQDGAGPGGRRQAGVHPAHA